MITEWKCNVCGEKRPDAQIAVHKMVVNFGGTPGTVNIKYCRDRIECVKGAAKIKRLEDFK